MGKAETEREEIVMRKKSLLLGILAFAFTLIGCQKYLMPTKIEPVSIPDTTYEVTVHESHPLYYAVLFDIPDDGRDVDIFYTYFTDRVGLDTPENYIDRFNSRIRYYSTVQINDPDGTVRGYLMVSNFLDYSIYERSKGETKRIIVMIDDPNLAGPGIRRTQ
jgi:hypothetical protein